MPQHFRALISIPLTSDNDDDALELAVAYAHSLRNDGAVIGHLELVGEVAGDDLLQITRVVRADPGFRRQLPFDWKA